MPSFTDKVEEYRSKSSPGHVMHLACMLLEVHPDRRPKPAMIPNDKWLMQAAGRSSISAPAPADRPSVSGLASGGVAAEGPAPSTPMPPILQFLSNAAPVLELLRPCDIGGFTAGVSKLGRHKGNLLFHFILAMAKYPHAVQSLATHLGCLDEQFGAADLQKVCHKAAQECSRMNSDKQATSTTTFRRALLGSISGSAPVPALA